MFFGKASVYTDPGKYLKYNGYRYLSGVRTN